MKKYILIIICLATFAVSAQNKYLNEKLDNNLSYSTNYNGLIDSIGKNEDDTKPKRQLHYGVSINQSLTRYGLPTAVLFTLNYKKHQFDIGPQFRLGRTINKSQKNVGCEFNYRFYPNGDDTHFSSYLLFNADYFFSYQKYLSTSSYYGGEVTNRHHYLEFNLGYGIKYKPIACFYLGSHVGAGIYREFSSVQKGTENNKRKEGDVGVIISFYIGYKF
nr:hypothetical protein [uncultured Fluviicola sp.]